ncbi:Ca2-binding protein [Aureococcus anophagefferens]|nr:Ca2-binding protein [Aureococcus anophagefferens]
MVLSQDEIDGGARRLCLNRAAPSPPKPPRPTSCTVGCRDAFLAFDKDRSGTIDVWELRQVLEAMGQKPTEEELFQMISEVDENMSGSIDFAEFLKVIENQKDRAENFDDENDMIDAFVACGGRPDKHGHVRRETLVKIIKHDFGLTIDIEELIDKIDTDLSGEIGRGVQGPPLLGEATPRRKDTLELPSVGRRRGLVASALRAPHERPPAPRTSVRRSRSKTGRRRA